MFWMYQAVSNTFTPLSYKVSAVNGHCLKMAERRDLLSHMYIPSNYQSLSKVVTDLGVTQLEEKHYFKQQPSLSDF